MLTSAFIGEATRCAGLVLVVGSILGAVLQGSQTLLAEAVVPPPGPWLLLCLLGAPLTWSLVVPASASVGVVWALQRWVRAGSWIGLMGSGVRGGQLGPAALGMGLAACLLTGALTLGLEPLLHRGAQRLVHEAGEVRLAANVPVRLGPLTVIASESDGEWARDVFLARADWVGTAAAARIVGSADGPVLELLDGVGAATTGRTRRIRWQRWQVPLGRSDRRIQMSERTHADLAAQALRTEQDGRSAAYERAVLYKRFLHPLSALWMPLAVLPLGAGRRPGWAIAVVATVHVAIVRLADHLAVFVGPVASASSGLCFIALVGVVAWWRWSDR